MRSAPLPYLQRRQHSALGQTVKNFLLATAVNRVLYFQVFCNGLQQLAALVSNAPS